MPKHKLEFTDDQLEVLISLFSIGTAIMAAELDLIPPEVALIRAIPDDSMRAAEVQAMLLSAADPEAWEKTLRKASARNN